MPIPERRIPPFALMPTTLGRRNMWKRPRLAEVTRTVPTSPMSARAASMGSGVFGRMEPSGVTAMRVETT